MHRRRQVQAPGARLEVVHVERVRIDVAVPADHVERVVVEQVALQAAADADRELEVAALAMGPELGGGWKSRWENGADSSSWP